MKKSLIYNIQMKFLIILSISLVILGGLLSILGVKFLKTQQRKTIGREAYPITTEVINYLRAQEDSSLSNLQKIVDIVSDSIEGDIVVTDNIGYIYLVSSGCETDPELKLLGKIVTDNEREILKGGNIYEKVENDAYIYMQPIFEDDYFGGVLMVKTSAFSIKREVVGLVAAVWICIVLAILSALIFVSHFTKKMIIEPITEINNAAQKITLGEGDKRVSIASDDEIGELAKSFNIMAESLNRIDATRRDFISNVSHELRSPITSIRGFIAAMIDGIIPADKEKYYLNIVYDEVKRLSRLVDDLLDVSTLDNVNYNLHKIDVDINGLIELCLASKEARIIKEDLKVEVILENNHQFVLADRDRIIQVITNLLDNAIKYSYSGETIKIETKLKGEKVYISIENKGEELSDEQLLRMWDRFYKSDSSRTNKESTGLGLSIVRTILSRHGEDIWVESNNGQTKFTFTLTRVL